MSLTIDILPYNQIYKRREFLIYRIPRSWNTVSSNKKAQEVSSPSGVIMSEVEKVGCNTQIYLCRK